MRAGAGSPPDVYLELESPDGATWTFGDTEPWDVTRTMTNALTRTAADDPEAVRKRLHTIDRLEEILAADRLHLVQRLTFDHLHEDRRGRLTDGTTAAREPERHRVGQPGHQSGPVVARRPLQHEPRLSRAQFRLRRALEVAPGEDRLCHSSPESWRARSSANRASTSSSRSPWSTRSRW